MRVIAKKKPSHYTVYMNILLSIIRKLFTLSVPLIILSACATSTDKISAELSPAELIQRAQEASDHNRYKSALQYYKALLERNQHNADMVCTGEYEVAFIHYKQKKYEQARGELNTLLERYNSPDAELLPQQFKRLASIVLNNIDEKEKPIFKRAKKK